MRKKSPFDVCCEAVRNAKPYRPGKPLSVTDRTTGKLTCLMSNENMLGPPKSAIDAGEKAVTYAHHYPDGPAEVLKEALARKINVLPGQITLGNGSNEILDLIARCFLSPGREAVYSKHAFAVYELVTQLSGARAQVASANSITSTMPYGDDFESLRKCISGKTGVVFIANPNNPTGTWHNGKELLSFIRTVPSSVIIVVDQAYQEYVTDSNYVDAKLWVGKYENVIVTNTFSKIYGLAGVRVGYSVSAPEVADCLNRARQPFNVNAIGQVMATAALGDDEHVQKSREMNSVGMEQVKRGCDKIGLSYLPSQANFLCIRVGKKMQAVYEHLFKNDVIVRPVENYNLPEYIRMTIGREKDNTRFLEALSKALDEV